MSNGLFSQTSDQQFSQASHTQEGGVYFSAGHRYWLRFDEMFDKRTRQGIMTVIFSFTVVASDDPKIPEGAQVSQVIKTTWDSWLSHVKGFLYAACLVLNDGDEEAAKRQLDAVWDKETLDTLLARRGDDLRGLEPIELVTIGVDTKSGGRFTQHHYSNVDQDKGEPRVDPDRFHDVGNQAAQGAAQGGSGGMFGQGGGNANQAPAPQQGGGSGGMFGRG